MLPYTLGLDRVLLYKKASCIFYRFYIPSCQKASACWTRTVACLPVPRSTWQWLQSLFFPSDPDNFWDSQKAQSNTRAGYTACEPSVIKTPASAPHRADIERDYEFQSVKASLDKHLPAKISIFFIFLTRFYSRSFPSRVRTVFPEWRHDYTPGRPDSSKSGDTHLEWKRSWFTAAALGQLLKALSLSERWHPYVIGSHILLVNIRFNLNLKSSNLFLSQPS